MKKVRLLLLLGMSWLGVAAQQLRNPVISGFHPDPSVCRVGDDYYLVNSSFQYFPGVPIFHSRDLVNWTQIGNVLDRDSQLPLQGASSWLGIYAPTLRYHDGRFYMITTNVGGGGNFLVTATDPRGPWSEPVWLEQQGIDPSLWFENGRCYMVSNPDNTIMLCEIDPTTGRQLTPSKPLWRGTGGRYPEGPHLYKKDGYYYLLISEGGTELAHRLTIARSRDIYGPYESNPQNPILTNCNMAGQSLQIQGTGHGDFVQSRNGTWWLVFLAYRNFGGSYHHLGRETFLAPVEWPAGQWPVVNGGAPVDTLMAVPSLPVYVAEGEPDSRPSAPSAVPSGLPAGWASLTPEWVFLQNPVRANYTFSSGALSLRPNGLLTDNRQPTFVGRRQESAIMTVETEVEVPAASSQPEAGEATDSTVSGGLTVYQIHDGHIDFCVTPDGIRLRTVLKSLRADCGHLDFATWPSRLSAASASQPSRPLAVRLRITSDGLTYRFSAAPAGSQSFTDVGTVDCSLVSTEVAGGFTGAVIGLYSEGAAIRTPVTFRQFSYTEK